MRVAVLVAVLTMFVCLGGCARNAEVAYVDPPPTPPHSYASATSTTPAPTQLQQRGSRSTPSAHWNTIVVTNAVEKAEPLFDRVEAKAEIVGVENLTQADIKGLSYDQIRKLRGY
jgi:hypothetical protein